MNGHAESPHVKRQAIHGLLVLNKPSGITSRRAVDHVIERLPGVKAGHAGTLDPLATGVLVVCLGAATRLVEAIQEQPKSYRVGVRLGARSDTLDADGRVEPEPCPRVPTGAEVAAVLPSLVGHVAQRPPEFSALKVQGRRAYDLARHGQLFDLAPRLVRIDRIAIVGYDWPRLELEVDCGSGTYIRSLARDIGDALGCGGLVQSLERTRIGSFTIGQAVSPAHLASEPLERHLRPALEAVAGWPRLVLDAGQASAVRQGRRLDLDALNVDPALLSAGNAALVDAGGTLVALAEIDLESRSVFPRKVFG